MGERTGDAADEEPSDYGHRANDQDYAHNDAFDAIGSGIVNIGQRLLRFASIELNQAIDVLVHDPVENRTQFRWHLCDGGVVMARSAGFDDVQNRLIKVLTVDLQGVE